MTDLFNMWLSALNDPFQALGARFIAFVPNLVGAIIILIVGWIIAAILDRIVTEIAMRLKIDVALNRAGFKKPLSASGFNVSASDIFGNLIRWAVLIVAFLGAAEVLGLSQISAFLNRVLAYLPAVIAAVGILLVGVIAGNFFAGLVRATAGGAKLKTARFLGGTTKWAFYFFAVIAALNQLGIASSLLLTLFTGFVAMIALAGGLSFGLGGQGLAKDILKEMHGEFKHK